MMIMMIMTDNDDDDATRKQKTRNKSAPNSTYLRATNDDVVHKLFSHDGHRGRDIKTTHPPPRTQHTPPMTLHSTPQRSINARRKQVCSKHSNGPTILKHGGSHRHSKAPVPLLSTAHTWLRRALPLMPPIHSQRFGAFPPHAWCCPPAPPSAPRKRPSAAATGAGCRPCCGTGPPLPFRAPFPRGRLGTEIRTRYVEVVELSDFATGRICRFDVCMGQSITATADGHPKLRISRPC